MAKTKQHYFNLGFDDFNANNPKKYNSVDSWQSRNYSLGWMKASVECASITQSQCIDIPYNNVEGEECKIIPIYSLVYRTFLGWRIINVKNSWPVFDTIIKRKTHARNVAAKLGYRIV